MAMRRDGLGEGWNRLGLLAWLALSGCTPDATEAQTVEKAVLSAPAGTPPLTVPRAIFGDVVLGASEWLEVGDRVRVETTAAETAISNTGAGITRVGSEATIGSVVSQGPIDLRDRARVLGSVQSATSVSVGSAVSVGGGTQIAAIGTMLNLEVPSQELGALQGDVRLEPGQSRIVAPGAYGVLAIKQQSTVKLSAGSYRFTEIMGDSGSRIEVDSTCGLVNVFVEQKLYFRSAIVDSGALGGAGLAILYTGTETAHVEAPFKGFVVAPSSELILNSGTHVGRFFARRLRVQAGATIIPDFSVTPPMSYCDGASLAPGPYCEFGLCCPSENAESHPQLSATCNQTAFSECLVGTMAADRLSSDTKLFFGRGGTDHLADSGTRKVLIGGDGDDALCASAASVLQGGPGDDVFRTSASGATVLPGGGADRIDVAAGTSITIATFDACEWASGDTLVLGVGATATLHTQLSRDEFLARGVTIPAGVDVRFANGNRCMSDCAGAPLCGAGEQCVDRGPLGVSCMAFSEAPVVLSVADAFFGLNPEARAQLEEFLGKILAGEHLGLAPAELRAKASLLVPALSQVARTEPPSAFRNACIEALGSLYTEGSVAELRDIAKLEPPSLNEPYLVPHMNVGEGMWFVGSATAVRWLGARAAKGDADADAALLDIAANGPKYARELAGRTYLRRDDGPSRRAILASALPADSQYVIQLQGRVL